LFSAVNAPAASADAALNYAATIFSASQSLSETLIQNPRWLDWLSSSDLRQPLGKNVLQFELAAAAGEAASDPDKFAAIRRCKRRHLLRIALRDLLGFADLAQTTLELSDLADACLEAVLRVATESLQKKCGIPLNAAATQPATFAILGMGKLGGRELNYSSDVDVIFVYSEDGFVCSPGGKQTAMTNEEFFTRLAENIIAAIAKISNEGSIYRMDLRLRPEGATGPLVRSLESCEDYYAALGETWERLALLKARCVAGDESLGAEFLRMVEPFVFRRYGGESVLRDMANIKSRIEHEIVKSNALTRHVKLGIGGIREIEFILQVLQVLHGGRHPEIRDANTLRGLNAVAQAGLLPQRDADALADAYQFLRVVEHRLQMEADLQTHTIPDETAAVKRLARLMGFRTVSDFLRKKSSHTAAVRKIYQRLLASAAPTSDAPGATAFLTFAHESGGEPVPDEIFLNALTRAGFAEPASAAQVFHSLAHGPGFGHVSAQTTERFAKLVPKILAQSRALAEPDAALKQFLRFVERYGSRGALFDAFGSNPRLLELLLKFFDNSPALGEELLLFPELFDDVVRGGALAQTKDIQTMLDELAAQSAAASADSTLRHYKRAELVRIALADVLGLADVEWTCTELSFLAEASMRFAVAACATELKLPEPPVAVIALGKFGGQELGYGADLDVLLVADDEGAQQPPTSRFAERLTEMMSKQTAQGVVFKLDFRLRPDGDQGPLTPSLTACRRYYTQRAWVWEKQSLTKARFIAGDPVIGRKFMELVNETIFAQPLTNQELGEIRVMRQRIQTERSDRARPELSFKTCAGGLVDIEFAVQSLQMRHGHKHPSLRCTPTLGALTRLAARGILEESDQYWLRQDYLFLRRLELVLRRRENTPVSTLPRDEAGQAALAKRLGFKSAEEFWKRYNTVRQRVRGCYERLT
jgi:glutamate-ammonia-ligase adenylyltransferase